MKNVIEYIGSMADGGAETLVKNYAIYMDKTKVNPLILTTREIPETANMRALAKRGIEINYIYDKWNTFTRVLNHFWANQYVPIRIKNMIIDNNIDVIHIHMNYLQKILPLSDFLKERKVKVFYTCHGKPECYFTGVYENEFNAAKKLIENNRLQLIALHKEMAEEMNEMFGVTNTVVVHNGIELGRFKRGRHYREETRQKLGLSQETFLVCHVGRLSEEKNHRFILDVFSVFQQINPDAVLLLIGSGPLEEEIKEKAESLRLSDKLIILSHRTDIPELLGAADAFLFPSIHEGFPLSVIEAQASGLRCVVSEAINKEALVTNLITRLSLEAGVEKWASELQKVIVPDNNEKLSEFDIVNVVREMEALYEK